MIHFFLNPINNVYGVQTDKDKTFFKEDLEKLCWLFGDAKHIDSEHIEDFYVGPRSAMISPWSTNAVEITQNMGIQGILRIEEFIKEESEFDSMLSQKFDHLDQHIFDNEAVAESVIEIDDIEAYNIKEGLSLNAEEIDYLDKVAQKIGRKLTDSEVFAFSQANSEHCRHKIFNGTFIIDGVEKSQSLFKLIKKTSETNPNTIISAYKDNVAFMKGPRVFQFAPKSGDKPDYYEEKEFDSVISLKAETHNFPTTVEPFSGAATGSGGEIRDRMAGGQGSVPLAGTAVYMTSYPRSAQNRFWEKNIPERPWLYQSPLDTLIKASNGASDFGNKFGQPLIVGSLLTFEHTENNKTIGYDKVIMQAGGVGYAKLEQAKKMTPKKGDQIIILGGDNYRIGMGGAAVSSADTGALGNGIEINAIQRSNPEMQKRVSNAIRALVEAETNPIVSIHDHGAGGHLNCLSELVEDTGGQIDLDKLPIGDPSLSLKEIIGNESQERMGLIIGLEDMETLLRIAKRERSPMYDVGIVTGDHRFVFESSRSGEKPMDYALSDFFGSSPKTIIRDNTSEISYQNLSYYSREIPLYLDLVLQLEAVACKDWLTNKVDRCVGGKVAKQQCVGALQLPLNNVGVVALDFKSNQGIATSIGHAPLSALIDPIAGSRNAIGETLSNIVFAPIKDGLSGVSLSANWMWACKTQGEDARLYAAVEGCSDFAIALGINIPTGKDSLSMKQKYQDQDVIAPGTVIISASGHCTDVRKVVEPVLHVGGGSIYYINLSRDSFKLGGSSFGQIQNKIGVDAPTIVDPKYFKTAFNAIQQLILDDQILAGHDIGSGGLITTLVEMTFAEKSLGAQYDLSPLGEEDSVKVMFAENIGVVLQARDNAVLEKYFHEASIEAVKIGEANSMGSISISNNGEKFDFNVSSIRDTWYLSSFNLDQKQSKNGTARLRFDNYKNQPLTFKFPTNFVGNVPKLDSSKARPKAAIIREKGSNSEREMANAMYLAGFDVKDVHMTDLISGNETLDDIHFIGAVGGFSNSDVLGSAKGWAGTVRYNENANQALKRFFERTDTMSIGICNGCQLFMELNLINPDHEQHGRMSFNDSRKHESGFVSVQIPQNNSIMMKDLAGCQLGVWISHGEGKFNLPYEESKYNIIAKYGYEAYPHNPNGSSYNTAMLCDDTGRHLVTMPHIERSIFQWNWANYPKNRKDEVTPWLGAFTNARKWIEAQQEKK